METFINFGYLLPFGVDFLLLPSVFAVGLVLSSNGFIFPVMQSKADMSQWSPKALVNSCFDLYGNNYGNQHRMDTERFLPRICCQYWIDFSDPTMKTRTSTSSHLRRRKFLLLTCLILTPDGERQKTSTFPAAPWMLFDNLGTSSRIQPFGKAEHWVRVTELAIVLI